MNHRYSLSDGYSALSGSWMPSNHPGKPSWVIRMGFCLCVRCLCGEGVHAYTCALLHFFSIRDVSVLTRNGSRNMMKL